MVTAVNNFLLFFGFSSAVEVEFFVDLQPASRIMKQKISVLITWVKLTMKLFKNVQWKHIPVVGEVDFYTQETR